MLIQETINEPDTLLKLLVSLDDQLQELQPQLVNAGRRLSETPCFPWSRPTVNAAKCVFNLVPCDNKFEQEFAQFLRDADDDGRARDGRGTGEQPIRRARVRRRLMFLTRGLARLAMTLDRFANGRVGLALFRALSTAF